MRIDFYYIHSTIVASMHALSDLDVIVLSC